MNKAVMFSKVSDEWATPHTLFTALDAVFDFGLDVAATQENTKCDNYYTQEENALVQSWQGFGAVWLNPPYSLCREFIAKAVVEAALGATVVCLVPSRTDTRWWHEHVWDRTYHKPYPRVEIRFLKGRLKFGGATAGAPFPSVVIIFRPL